MAFGQLLIFYPLGALPVPEAILPYDRVDNVVSIGFRSDF